MDHYGTITQEPQLTSRIGQALETRVNGMKINGYHIRVVTQDLPDRGPASLESRSGADLYVGFDVNFNGATQSKGMLVQAKWDGATSGRQTTELRKQARKMLEYSQDGYVWVYSSEGVRVLPAQRVLRNPPPQRYRGRPLNQLFEDVLECASGDPKIGVPPGQNSRAKLGRMLETLSAPTGILVHLDSSSH